MERELSVLDLGKDWYSVEIDYVFVKVKIDNCLDHIVEFYDRIGQGPAWIEKSEDDYLDRIHVVFRYHEFYIDNISARKILETHPSVFRIEIDNHVDNILVQIYLNPLYMGTDTHPETREQVISLLEKTIGKQHEWYDRAESCWVVAWRFPL